MEDRFDDLVGDQKKLVTPLMGKEVKRYIATKTFPTHLSVQATNKDPVDIQDWSSSNNEIDMESGTF